jgi:hypothetical protein
MTSYVDYGWTFSEPDHTDAYLLEPIAALLPPLPADRPGWALDLVVSTEAMEHLYAPREWTAAAHAALACAVVFF